MTANARRSLKAIETLARAEDFELAELKRTANAAADRFKRTVDAIRFLEAALISEAPEDGADLSMRWPIPAMPKAPARAGMRLAP